MVGEHPRPSASLLRVRIWKFFKKTNKKVLHSFKLSTDFILDSFYTKPNTQAAVPDSGLLAASSHCANSRKNDHLAVGFTRLETIAQRFKEAIPPWLWAGICKRGAGGC